MDTTTSRTNKDSGLEKTAAGAASLLPFINAPKNLLMTYLTAAAALGLAGGAGVGAAMSHIKSKSPKLTALSRKKKYYDSKVDEMENENWLNEVMSAKKKLETSKLSDEERTELEKKYIKLLDRK